METLLEALHGKDHKAGCAAMERLVELSAQSSAVYAHWDVFAALLKSGNSLQRNRGLSLIAANARWDTDCRLNGCLADVLACVNDPKPITARWCVQRLPILAAARPDLAGEILAALRRADVRRYKDSMRGLVAEDIRKAILQIEERV